MAPEKDTCKFKPKWVGSYGVEAGGTYIEQDHVREQESTHILFRRLYLKEPKCTFKRPEKNQSSGVPAFAAFSRSVAQTSQGRSPGSQVEQPCCLPSFA